MWSRPSGEFRNGISAANEHEYSRMEAEAIGAEQSEKPGETEIRFVFIGVHSRLKYNSLLRVWRHIIRQHQETWMEIV
jgi:hypothetical protein